MVGFALAVPGVRAGHPYLHSHMLAVRKDYRNGGLGRRIKLFQREEALARGFELIEWTFDPLEIKNAYLNIEKLGAIARRYTINQYGITTSPLARRLADRPSGRGMVAEVEARGKRCWNGGNRRPAVETGDANFGSRADLRMEGVARDPRPGAREVQEHNREQFLKAFDQGLACSGYERIRKATASFCSVIGTRTWSLR